MPYDNKYPVKILDNLYVFGVLSSNDKEKEEFLKLPQIDKIECLINQGPSVKQSKFKLNEKRYYTPSFGNFVISPSEKELLKFYDLHLTQKKSEELFSEFEKEYSNIVLCYEKLEEFTHSKHTP